MIGTQVRQYRIRQKLGEGGMGEVFLAEDTTLGRSVALKFIPRHLSSDPDFRSRFEHEAKSAASLNHPNIVVVYELNEHDGRLFIAMECVNGRSLESLIREGRLDMARALEIARQVCEGLKEAHLAGIVHRDVKPSNILIDERGRAKLLDFGLAKSRRATTQTKTGTLLGTLPYESPEQATGQPVDARSDLFSLGVVLYEMIAGRRPFQGELEETVRYAILTEVPEPLARYKSSVPSELQRIVSKLLEKDVRRRYQTAADLAVDLLRLTPDSPDDSSHRQATPSIAVMPFTNMGGAPEDDFLCEGLSEEIIYALTRVPGLRVIARTSAFAVARMGLDVREAGVRLDVDNILDGSVRRSGSRIRVSAQLVSCADGDHVWSSRYDREFTDVLVLEDEIAAEIASRLRAELAPAIRPQKRAVADFEGYQDYLEGRYHFARGTPQALERAEQCFRKAIDRNPQFALSYDALAEAYWYRGLFGVVRPQNAFRESALLAQRALELDDDLAETHALLGMLRKELDYNWAEVEREHRRAFELNPDSPLVHLRYAMSGLLPHGRIDAAAAEVDVVLQSDPLSIFVRWWRSVMLVLGRRPEDVLDEGRHMVALDATHHLGHWALGMGYDGQGKLSEAVSAMERAHELSGGMPLTAGFLALIYGHAGRNADAHALLSRARTEASTSYVPPSTLALGFSGLGDWDAACMWWERAIETRDPMVMPLKTYPFLDPIRPDARYRALLGKMNLSE